jgi:ABC-type Zn2+ transport system substrate-binding protein/surface adhesin
MLVVKFFKPVSILYDSLVIRQNKETNSSAVKGQKRIIENEIQELRTKINNHLDRLQENLMTELDEAEIEVTDETRELLVSLEEKQNYYVFHDNYILTITMIFHVTNSTTRTLMFSTV